MHDLHCLRGPRCDDAQTDIDTQRGERTRRGAATRHDGPPLCDACVRLLTRALQLLPGDVAELTTLLRPSTAITYRDPSLPAAPRVKLHAPLPINAQAEALRALIDHELTTWAEFVADEAGVPWSTFFAGHQRVGVRTQQACQLIAHRLDWLWGIPARDYLARSTGEHPTDGHGVGSRDERQVWCEEGRWWLRRDGVDAALLIIDLHEQVERFVGRAPADRLPERCPTCARRALHRVHRRLLFSGRGVPGAPGYVECHHCWARLSDDEHAALSDITASVFGGAG